MWGLARCSSVAACMNAARPGVAATLEGHLADLQTDVVRSPTLAGSQNALPAV